MVTSLQARRGAGRVTSWRVRTAGLAWGLAGAAAWAGQVPPAQRAPAATWQRIVGVARTIWAFTLFTVGDTSVLVNQVVVAFLIVAVGLWVIRRIRRALHERLLRHSRIDVSAAAAVEKLLFYVLLSVLVLLALNVLRIPITLFTFLGGALAIGVGFGAQNIIGNFISGLVLMFERPIRIGDLVEVGPNQGRVEEIGFRCTRIRRNDGIHILVPNSLLLEQSVVNWTLIDRKYRAEVSVGVQYGSPTDTVARLIRQAVDETARALDQPEPMVIFEDFGDNALLFVIYFWVEVRSIMERRVICSDVRFRIDRLFREAGIVIAFPQRDVHLDTASPLEVRVVPGGGPGASGEAAAGPG